MNRMRRHPLLSGAVVGVLRSPRFAQALTTAIVGTAFFSFAIRSTIGWPGLLAIVCTLVVVAALSIVVRREDVEWRGIVPISLIVFLGWSTLSVVWSEYQWASLGAISYQLAFAALGVYVASTRDQIQVVRAFGDVLRVAIAASLTLEVLAGILLDVPVPFLHIVGNLDQGGPIQGIAGSRNQLGLLAVLALVTFVVELRTRSVSREVSVGSIVAAGLTVLLTRSPVTLAVVLVVAVAMISLAGLRRSDPERRRTLQLVLVSSVAVTILVIIAARTRVLTALNAGSEFEVRYVLWRRILNLSQVNTLEGFGWIGTWRRELPPYFGLDVFSRPQSSALNAFLDVLLQLGIVGMFAFIAFVGLALVRSWIVASNKRSVVYTWPALLLVGLILTSVGESFVLVEYGWLTLVICAVQASQNLSWRTRLVDA